MLTGAALPAGGWAGFGAAKHLSAEGVDVTLLDASPNPGGLSAGWRTKQGRAVEAGVKGFWYQASRCAHPLLSAPYQRLLLLLLFTNPAAADGHSMAAILVNCPDGRVYMFAVCKHLSAGQGVGHCLVRFNSGEDYYESSARCLCQWRDQRIGPRLNWERHTQAIH